jgi:hypothetical protein
LFTGVGAKESVLLTSGGEIEMYDYSSAVAKLRGLELIAEAAADRKAASLCKEKRHRDRHVPKGPAVPMGSKPARPAMAK